MKKVAKRLCGGVLASLLALTLMFGALPCNVYAAGVNAPSAGTFWTSDQLGGLSDTDLGTKANYGNGREWYAIGADNGSLVMLSDSAIGGSNIAFDSGGSKDYSNSAIKTNLNGSTEVYSVGQLFSTEEQAQITEAYGGKLYLPDTNNYGDTNFKVGSGNQYTIPIATWKGKNSSHGVQSFFWLRSSDNSGILCVFPNAGDVARSVPRSGLGSVVPAFNLNLSSVLFSSAAPVPQGGTDEVTVNGSMRFRFDGSEKIKSTATYYGGKVNVTKSGEDSGLYLCIQYNYASKDWFYSEEISESGEVDPSIDSDLSNAKIWLEKKDGSLLYAKMATAGSAPNPDPNPNPNPNPNPDPNPNPNPDPTPAPGEKYTDVTVSSGSVKDITNSTQIAKSENPFSAKIVNNTILEQLLGITSTEKAQGVNVWLDIKSTTVDKATQDKIVAAAKGYTVDTYLDVNLYKKIGVNTPEKVRTLTGKMKISLVVPENLRKAGRSYRLIRLHNGNATAIPGTLNTGDYTLTFETDGFSTYAIAYSDNTATSPITSPKTGESSTPYAGMVLMIVSVFALTILIRKKTYKI